MIKKYVFITILVGVVFSLMGYPVAGESGIIWKNWFIMGLWDAMFFVALWEK